MVTHFDNQQTVNSKCTLFLNCTRYLNNDSDYYCGCNFVTDNCSCS